LTFRHELVSPTKWHQYPSLTYSVFLAQPLQLKIEKGTDYRTKPELCLITAKSHYTTWDRFATRETSQWWVVSLASVIRLLQFKSA